MTRFENIWNSNPMQSECEWDTKKSAHPLNYSIKLFCNLIETSYYMRKFH